MSVLLALGRQRQGDHNGGSTRDQITGFKMKEKILWCDTIANLKGIELSWVTDVITQGRLTIPPVWCLKQRNIKKETK